MAHTHHLLSRSTTGPNAGGRVGDPAYQAFLVLRGAFTIAPIVFGADKFLHLLVNWDRYLAPAIAGLSPLSVHHTMYVVGVVEIVAGLVVALAPRLGAPVVALWLAGIIVDLLLIPGYYDVALRDFGLLLAAVALWRLATVYDTRRLPWEHRG
ncbi:MAG: hypothetical protein ACXVXB_13595 [Nocardioidaceae bacterium]